MLTLIEKKRAHTLDRGRKYIADYSIAVAGPEQDKPCKGLLA